MIATQAGHGAKFVAAVPDSLMVDNPLGRAIGSHAGELFLDRGSQMDWLQQQPTSPRLTPR